MSTSSVSITKEELEVQIGKLKKAADDALVTHYELVGKLKSYQEMLAFILERESEQGEQGEQINANEEQSSEESSVGEES